MWGQKVQLTAMESSQIQGHAGLPQSSYQAFVWKSTVANIHCHRTLGISLRQFPQL